MHLKAAINKVASVAALQWIAYLTGFLTIPLITRALGTHAYGVLALSLAINGFLLLWIDFGTSTIGTREIAALTSESRERSRVLSEIFFARLLLLAIGEVSVITVALIVADRQISLFLIFGCVLTGIGALLFPNWYLEGRQMIAKSACILFAARMSQVLLVVVFVKSPADLLSCILIESSINIFAGLIVFLMQPEAFAIKLIHSRGAKRMLRQAAPLFLSNIGGSLYSSSGAIILSAVSGSTSAAYFTLADKLLQAAKRLLSPIFSVAFPYFSSIATKSPTELQEIRSKFFVPLLLIGLLVSTLLFFSADTLISVVSGSAFTASATLLKLMSPIPLALCVSNYYGVQTLVVERHNGIFSRILVFAGVIGLIALFGSAMLAAETGLATCVTAIEISVALSLFLAVRFVNTSPTKI